METGLTPTVCDSTGTPDALQYVTSRVEYDTHALMLLCVIIKRTQDVNRLQDAVSKLIMKLKHPLNRKALQEATALDGLADTVLSMLPQHYEALASIASSQ